VPDRLFDAGLYDITTKSPDVERWLGEQSYDSADGHDHSHHHNDVNRHNDHIQAYCIASDDAISMNGFNLFVELLQSYHGPNLLRVKGIVKLEEQPETPVIIHGVQHVWHPPVELAAWPDGDRRTRLVFITRDIAKAEIEGLFAGFEAAVFAYGHVHIPNMRRLGNLVLANISSVNLPQDGDVRAKYGLLTWEKKFGWSVEQHRVEYDLNQELDVLAHKQPPDWENMQKRLQA